VIGEAEPVWGEILADLAQGSLQARYQSAEYWDMKGLPLPRRDLLSREHYLTVNVVQTARGCPNGCTFCSVTTVAGKHYRFRPVCEVVEEVRSLEGWVGFVDDNITGNPARARELFEALIPLKIRWVGQADLNMAKDPELLKLAVRSGCHALFVGLESLSQENLRTTHKVPNVGTDMAAAIATIHRAGIEVIGSFVLGLDGDDKSVFAKTVKFARRQKLCAAQFAVLTPFPGTVIHQQLESEGRIRDHDWSHYTMSDVVFQPKNMTPEELHQGRQWTYRTFYSLPSILARSLTLRGNIPLKLLVNRSYRAIGYNKGLAMGLPSS
ncbi:MAG: radical SAM protein, partial [Candidatus Berkelbacteria bacterium]|nr:radical SAM protein [Candidatus Berkelbacteria bacterium]